MSPQCLILSVCLSVCLSVRLSVCRSLRAAAAAGAKNTTSTRSSIVLIKQKKTADHAISYGSCPPYILTTDDNDNRIEKIRDDKEIQMMIR